MTETKIQKEVRIMQIKQMIKKFDRVEKDMNKVLKLLSPVQNTPIYCTFYNFKVAISRFVKGLKDELQP